MAEIMQKYLTAVENTRNSLILRTTSQAPRHSYYNDTLRRIESRNSY